MTLYDWFAIVTGALIFVSNFTLVLSHQLRVDDDLGVIVFIINSVFYCVFNDYFRDHWRHSFVRNIRTYVYQILHSYTKLKKKRMGERRLIPRLILRNRIPQSN